MQLQAVASMRQKDDYAKRYDLLKVTLHNIIKVSTVLCTTIN